MVTPALTPKTRLAAQIFPYRSLSKNGCGVGVGDGEGGVTSPRTWGDENAFLESIVEVVGVAVGLGELVGDDVAGRGLVVAVGVGGGGQSFDLFGVAE